jgi:hypothetical protein
MFPDVYATIVPCFFSVALYRINFKIDIRSRTKVTLERANVTRTRRNIARSQLGLGFAHVLLRFRTESSVSPW